MAIKAEILLIEDDPDIAENIQEYLTNKSKGQWTLHIADNGRDGAELAAEEDYAVILLDVNLPGMDGFAVCRNLRKQGIQTPVIFLTARFAEEDALKGYESGGDDYLVKPFSLAQLFAKMSALLNRLNGGAQEEFTCGDLTVNRSERKIFLAGEALTLPPKEYDILLYFLEHPNRLISKESLIVGAWGYDSEMTERGLDNHIKNIRKAIQASEMQITTIRKLGYRFCQKGAQ